MQVLKTKPELAAYLSQSRQPRVFVPTMGSLHAGHLYLIDRARELGPLPLVSIFVNPMQFQKTQDFENYPKNLDQDLLVLEGRAGAVFAPDLDQMYPDGPTCISIDAGGLGQILEGEYRRGFFSGVLTAVAKLLHLIQPDFALFSRKDAQQAFLIDRMTKELNFVTRIITTDFLRQENGLPYSSRNAELSLEQEKAAAGFCKEFSQFRPRVDQIWSSQLVGLRQKAKRLELAIDYLSPVSEGFELQNLGDRPGPGLLLLAFRVGKIRILDSLKLD